MAADWPADDGDFAARLAEYADGSANERKLLFDYGPLIFPRLVTIACSDRPGLRAAGLDALGRLIKLVGLGRMLVRALCSEAGLNNPSLEVQKECALAIGRVMQACSSLPDEDRDNIGWIRVLPHLVRLCAQPETTVGAEQALLHLRSLLGPRSFHRRFTRALLAYHENLMERTINIGNTSLVDLERKGDDVAEGLGQDLVGPSLSWTLWHLVKEGPLDTSVDGLRALAAAIEPHPKSSRDILLTLLPMIESFDIEVSEAALTAAAAHFHHDTCFDIVSSHPMVSVITKRERSREGPRTTRKTTVVPGPSHPASAPQTTAQRSSASISTAQPASFAPASARVASPASAYLRKPSLDLSELESAHNSNPETASLPSRTALASSSSSSPSPSPAPASVFSNAGNSMMKMTAQLSTLKRKTSGRKRLGSAASSDDLRPQSAGRSRMSARSSPLSASSARSVSSENGRPPPTMGAPRHELALSARESLPATSDGIVKLLLDDSQWQDQVRVLNAIKSNQHTGVLPPNCRSDAAVIQAVIKLTSSLRSSLSKSSLLCLHFLISDNGRGFWREQSPALVDAIVGALIKRSIDASTFLAQEARSALDACVQSFPANKFCLSLLQHCHAHPNARARANAANALHSIVQTSPPSAYDAGRVVSCAKDKLLHDNSVEARAAAKGILMQLNETQNLDRKQQLHLERIGASPLARKQPTHAARLNIAMFRAPVASEENQV
ncbi:Hypothetical Protein FCC1311_087652 [Hondaea fermentalgiana]|uniref:TOG domain-containing protein n=1 Tax=Hondaea fermentalgiana TaxID=2315210 RepID=A0A2R5GVV1_9STRA|nr:Hypothetical Protein FCC1311_087652 [Hondaea fermentalgiana]|eukprot:GBG32541.1 Hypothetical Protein FCC1311_087652 [Hondaea fermentalgiana]